MVDLRTLIASALSLDTRDARWEEFNKEKENYRQRWVQQQLNNGDFLERVGAVRDQSSAFGLLRNFNSRVKR
jgi:hypothetical protein